MQKFVSIVFALLLMAAVSGCGKGSTAIQATLPARIPLSATDVSGRTFFSTSISGSAAYQIKDDLTAAWNSAPGIPVSPDINTSGTWSISGTGALLLTETATAVTHSFTCLQKESSYFLMADENNNLSRFYFDTITAQAYLNSVVISSPPVFPLRVQLGGSIQGSPLVSVFGNVTTLAGHPGTPPILYSDAASNGTGTAASFNQPNGITTDGTNLYVADFKNNLIRKIVIADGTVTRLAGSPVGAAGNANSTDGTGDTAAFNLPSDVTTDGKFLYVADTGNNSIRKIDISSRSVTLIAGSTTGVAGSADALNGSDARFNQPRGITTDGTNLYVADSGNNTIRKIVLSSGAVATLAGAAASVGSTDSTDGTGATARFNQPARIATDGSNLYVTDFKNGTVRKVVIATGAVTTLAGSAGNFGFSDSTDNTGATARFNQPDGIATDGANLYVTDIFYNTIRQIVIKTGAVTTIAGTSSFLHTPIGITTDGISLFVADTFNLNPDTSVTYYNTIYKMQ